MNLVTHLVADFPTPFAFEKALETFIKLEINRVEIQLPFNHPLADGPTIRKANYIALSYETKLESLLRRVSRVVHRLKPKRTKIILMTYLTPIVRHLRSMATLLRCYGFHGTIIPDLPMDSPEASRLVTDFQSMSLDFIPILTPLTPTLRVKGILEKLRRDSPVYASLRTGQTGQKTDITSEPITKFMRNLSSTLENHPGLAGFGIRTKEQVREVQNVGLVPVVGTAIVEILSKTIKPEQQERRLTDFIHSIA